MVFLLVADSSNGLNVVGQGVCQQVDPYLILMVMGVDGMVMVGVCGVDGDGPGVCGVMMGC